MANVVSPMGFQVANSLSGGTAVGQGRIYFIPQSDTSAYYIGDAVKSAVGSDTLNGVPTIQKCTGADTEFTRGVLVGVMVNDAIGAVPNNQGYSLNLERIYIPANKNKSYYVFVHDDPNSVFEIQDDGNGSNVLATIAGYSSKNCTFTVTAPSNPLIPISATVLNFGTSPNVSATLPIKILGMTLVQNPGGGNQLAQYARWLVKFNNHELAQSSVGV